MKTRKAWDAWDTRVRMTKGTYGKRARRAPDTTDTRSRKERGTWGTLRARRTRNLGDSVITRQNLKKFLFMPMQTNIPQTCHRLIKKWRYSLHLISLNINMLSTLLKLPIATYVVILSRPIFHFQRQYSNTCIITRMKLLPFVDHQQLDKIKVSQIISIYSFSLAPA